MQDAHQESTPLTLLHTRKIDCNGYRYWMRVRRCSAQENRRTTRCADLPRLLRGFRRHPIDEANRANDAHFEVARARLVQKTSRRHK